MTCFKVCLLAPALRSPTTYSLVPTSRRALHTALDVSAAFAAKVLHHLAVAWPRLAARAYRSLMGTLEQTYAFSPLPPSRN